METSSSFKKDEDRKQLQVIKKNMKQQRSRFLQNKMVAVLKSDKYSHILKGGKSEDLLKEFALWLKEKDKPQKVDVFASERALSFQTGTCSIHFAAVQFLPNVPGSIPLNTSFTVTGVNKHTYAYGKTITVSPESNYLHFWVYYRKILNGLVEIRLQHKVRLSPFMRIIFPTITLEWQDDYDDRILSANGVPDVSALLWHRKIQNTNDNDKICENNVVLPWCQFNSGSQSQGYFFPSLNSITDWFNPLIDLGFQK